MRLINCIQTNPIAFLVVFIIITILVYGIGFITGYQAGVDTALKKDEEFLQAYFESEDDV